MRGVDVQSLQIDAPWLLEDGEGSLLVNDVDVAPFVEAELNRRFPGRADRRATDPDGLRAAWAALERAWAATLARTDAMPAGSVDRSVDGEWSFAQTLRHLVLATDMWLGRAILERDQPFHPLGLTDSSLDDEGFDISVSRPNHRRTPRSSRPGPADRRWCATSSPTPRRRSWPGAARTRMTPTSR